MDKSKGFQQSLVFKPSASDWLKRLLESNQIQLFTPAFEVYKAIYTYIETVFTPIAYSFEKGFCDGGNSIFQNFFTTAVSTDMPGADSGFCTVVYERRVYYCRRQKGTRDFIKTFSEAVGHKCVYESGYVYYRNFKQIPLSMPAEERDVRIKDFFREVIKDETAIRSLIDERG